MKPTLTTNSESISVNRFPDGSIVLFAPLGGGFHYELNLNKAIALREELDVAINADRWTRRFKRGATGFAVVADNGEWTVIQVAVAYPSAVHNHWTCVKRDVLCNISNDDLFVTEHVAWHAVAARYQRRADELHGMALKAKQNAERAANKA